MLGIPLSLERKLVSLTEYEVGANTATLHAQPTSQYNEYTRGKGEDGKVWRQKQVARHFSQLIDGKLPCILHCSGDVTL